MADPDVDLRVRWHPAQIAVGVGRDHHARLLYLELGLADGSALQVPPDLLRATSSPILGCAVMCARWFVATPMSAW